MTGLHIRAAAPEDLAALHGLATAFTPELTGQVDGDEFFRRAQHRISTEDRRIAVAENDDALIGYAAAQDYGPGLRAPFSVGRPQPRRRRSTNLWDSPRTGAGTIRSTLASPSTLGVAEKLASHYAVTHPCVRSRCYFRTFSRDSTHI